ncbi:MAG: ABC transporter ATP-binding protein, partial [Burkholderiales bacterium]|nr:ABC transporter ATP-binding protein [Anaerolineae bacterium]
IVGETGSGKTITALSIPQLIPGGQMSGEVWFDGENVASKRGQALQQFRARRLGMVFQDPTTNLNPVFTIGEQLIDAVLTQTFGVSGWKLLPIGKWFSRRERREAQAKAIELLQWVGIPDPEQRLDSYPHQFSGGQKQRILIAMALAGDPDLLVADEPTTALDVAIQAQILRLIQRVVEERHVSVVLITHDMGVIAKICNRVAVMYGGVVVEQGPIGEIFDNPKHPYTRGLLSAIPRDDVEQGELRGIPGSPPNFLSPPTGCRFHPRCPERLPHCHLHSPADTVVGAGGQHSVACYLYTRERRP